MEPKDTAASRGLFSAQRPLWQRILIWAVAAFVLFNLLSLAAVSVRAPGVGMGNLLRLALAGAVVGVPLRKWHGMNVLRTWRNPATSAFTRRDDPATGGYLFDIQPARAARMPALPLFAAGAFALFSALLVGTRSTGGFIWLFIIALVCIGVGCTFVLPGARDRKPARVGVSRHGVQSGDIGIPLGSVADLGVAHDGLVVASDPLMPGRNGVPIASMAGRHMGRRQAARGYAVWVRAEGESQPAILAGGLTEDCAHALAADLTRAIDAQRQDPDAGVVSAGAAP